MDGHDVGVFQAGDHLGFGQIECRPILRAEGSILSGLDGNVHEFEPAAVTAAHTEVQLVATQVGDGACEQDIHLERVADSDLPAIGQHREVDLIGDLRRAHCGLQIVGGDLG